MSVYSYEYTSIEGKPVKMSEYKDKVLLIVNTASKCGFTPQYEGLQKLYDDFNDKGLEIIGFPSNQFMDQEPGTNEEVADFCKIRFGVTFPLSQKVEVRDDNAIPLYKYLTSQKGFKGLGKGIKTKSLEILLRKKYKDSYSDDQIKWNFTKFLIDQNGDVISRFEPPVTPEEIRPEIERILDI